MKNQLKKLVLFNGKEVTLTELKEAREYAIDEYYKAEKRKDNAVLRMQEAKDIIQGLDGRIRLLSIMEKL